MALFILDNDTIFHPLRQDLWYNTFKMPKRPKEIIPETIKMIVFDFDGVFTNNEVIVNQRGEEMVICNRLDGKGISLLKRLNIPMLIISSEANPVITARAKKLNIETIQNVHNKKSKLLGIINQKKINLKNVIYVGNDIDDLECMRIVGCSVAPADAYPSVIKEADLVLEHNGGKGAIRELADLIIDKLK